MSRMDEIASRPRVLAVHVAADEAWAQWLVEQSKGTGYIMVARPGEARIDAGAMDALWVVYSEASAQSSEISSVLKQAREAGLPVRYLVADATAIPSRSRSLDLVAGSPERVARKVGQAFGYDTSRGSPRQPQQVAPRSPRPTADQATEVRAEDSSQPLARVFPAPHVPPGPIIARGELIETLSAVFADTTDSRKFVVLVGPRGSGKTTLAARFVSEYRARFGQLLWTSGPNWRRASRRLAASMARPDDGGGLTAARPALIVVDDLESDRFGLLDRDIPEVADVLVTTNEWGELRDVHRRVFDVVDVGLSVSFEAADQFVRNVFPEASADEVEEIVTETAGTVPLLATVGQYRDSWRRGEANGVLQTARGVETAEAGQYALDADDPRVIARWERAFVQLLGEGAIRLGEFRRGSWIRKWWRSPEVRSAAEVAARAAEVAAVAVPESVANLNNSQAIAQLIAAAASIDNLVANSGSIVLVKFTDEAGRAHVLTKTLTPSQLRAFNSDKTRLESAAEAYSYFETLKQPELDPGDPPLLNP